MKSEKRHHSSEIHMGTWCHSMNPYVDYGIIIKLFVSLRDIYMIRLLLTIIFLFPLFLTAETIVVKTKAAQNRNAVFQYRVPRGYDKNRREMYRVLVIFGGRLV